MAKAAENSDRNKLKIDKDFAKTGPTHTPVNEDHDDIKDIPGAERLLIHSNKKLT